MTIKGANYISYDHHDGGHYSDTVFEDELPSHSRLLDANGEPMQYKDRKIKLGFDLTRNKDE